MRTRLLHILIILAGIVFISRLLYLQVFSVSNVNVFEDNAIRKIYDYPNRGLVYDRNGKLLVANQPSYDIMVIPQQVKAFDTTEFAALLKISKERLKSNLASATNYSPRLPSVLLSQVSKSDYASLQEKMHRYTGFYIQKRSLRQYNTAIGANVLGDIGEVNYADIKKNTYYKLGDLKGKQGVEASYEDILRGIKGVKYIQKDRFNRDIGSFKNGIFDTIPIRGKDITITIDSKLQAYGEILMQNKRGGIIAIEPKSGEILAMVSAPTYNPNILVGRQRSENFTKLFNDTVAKPLFNRSLQGVYEPGSPFKLVNALVGLQENVITPNDVVVCNGGFTSGRLFVKCHCPYGTRNNLISAIKNSCNTYFATVYKNILDHPGNASKGIDIWSKDAKSLGLGNFLNNDLFVGRKGRIPDREYYKHIYPTTFYSTYTISNAIGQGEVATTPIQLANMTAAIANRGFYFTPHIIKHIEKDTIPNKFKTPIYSTINPSHFEPVIDGMLEVYKYGTANTLQVDGIEICGKTGTVENFTKINGVLTQLTDHSIFVAFAPKDDPKIAIAVFVENGYWGSRYAGRIASLMIEYYLKGSITRPDLEDWILQHTLEKEYAKPISGSYFGINKNATVDVVSNEDYLRLKEELENLKKQN